MKGILLAGGADTRLYPITRVVSKQLQPVYDKPMIYYPLSVLMLAGIRDILIISTPHDLPLYRRLFDDGSYLGLNITYAEQPRPEGVAQSFVIGSDFIGTDPVCLIFGDNIFYGHGLGAILDRAGQLTEGGLIFGYAVTDPERYGVIEFDDEGRVISIEEKPELLGRGYCWLDTGTFESLHQASGFVQAIQERQGLKIACIEEIAYRRGYIDAAQLEQLAQTMAQNSYGQFLLSVLNE